MVKVRQKFFENILLEELLSSEGFLGSSSLENLKDKKGFFLGLRKGFSVFDLEKSLTTYFNAINLVKAFNESSLQILFIGCPSYLEKTLEEEFINSRHLFVRGDSWVLGYLTNFSQSNLSPSLIVTFKESGVFQSKECFKEEIPLISFVDDTSNLNFVDYPILVNLKSKGASLMYHNLIKQAISKSDV